jgi:hypothetical protein
MLTYIIGWVFIVDFADHLVTSILRCFCSRFAQGCRLRINANFVWQKQLVSSPEGLRLIFEYKSQVLSEQVNLCSGHSSRCLAWDSNTWHLLSLDPSLRATWTICTAPFEEQNRHWSCVLFCWQQQTCKCVFQQLFLLLPVDTALQMDFWFPWYLTLSLPLQNSPWLTLSSPTRYSIPLTTFNPWYLTIQISIPPLVPLHVIPSHPVILIFNPLWCNSFLTWYFLHFMFNPLDV